MRLQDTAPELDWTIFADVLQPESETAGEGAEILARAPEHRGGRPHDRRRRPVAVAQAGPSVLIASG